jgi:uncharacterized RDD family membrane protein YckC
VRIDRLALGPVRAAARSGRGILTDEAERAIDALFAGPLPEAVGRSLVEHHVLERVAAGMLETAAPDGLTAADVERLVERVRRSPALERLTAGEDGARGAEDLARRVVNSAAFKGALRDVLSSPEIRAAMSSQATGFADEVAIAFRRRTRELDKALTHLLRRPAEPAARFGGLFTRALGLVLDAALAELGFFVLAGAIAVVVALAGGLEPGWVDAVLAGAGWLVAAGVYFIAFWSSTGQTPGMRVMRVRVVTAAGKPPSVAWSSLRFVGLIVSIALAFVGFLPVLIDSRRRVLHDFLGRTVVVDEAAG